MAWRIPEGYRKARRLMRQAEIWSTGSVPGRYFGCVCGIGAEERGEARRLPRNLMEMSGLKTPIVSVVTGEGGSGGALALSVADRILMLSSSCLFGREPRGLRPMKEGYRSARMRPPRRRSRPPICWRSASSTVLSTIRGLSHGEIAGAVMSRHLQLLTN